MARNYTVGRGEVHLALFAAGTQVHKGYRYLGNSPEFSLTLESENLDHFSSDRGIREKDASTVIEVARSGQMIADEIMAENIGMFLFGEAETVSVVGGAVADEEINGVLPGRMYQLGESDASPTGAQSIIFPGADAAAFSLTDDAAGEPYAAGEDFVLDPERGLLTIVEGGAIQEGTNLLVSYTTEDHTIKRIKSGSEPVNCALKYVTYNPIGEQFVWTLPWITVRPNGDFNLKGDEWQQIPYAFEILRKGALEGVYVNGAPFRPEP